VSVFDPNKPPLTAYQFRRKWFSDIEMELNEIQILRPEALKRPIIPNN